MSLLSSCANIKNDDTRTRTEGTLAGTVGGAVLGGLLGGLMSGGSPNGIVSGALSGGASGGGAGYLHGRSVAYRKKEYASTEGYLDACIAEVKQEVAVSRGYNEWARRIVARQQRQLAELKAALSPAPLRVEAFRQAVETNLTNIDTGLQHWQIIIDAHRQVVQRTRDRDRRETLTNEIRDLSRERSELLEHKDRFLHIQNQIPK